MKIKKWLVVAIFLGLAVLVIVAYGCGGGGPTGPSSSIVGTWEGYSPGLGINVKLVFTPDGKYEEYRQNMSCPFRGTYVDYGNKVTVTKTGGFCGTFTEPVVVNWPYRLEGNQLYIWDTVFERRG